MILKGKKEKKTQTSMGHCSNRNIATCKICIRTEMHFEKYA
jgi:hypothetical protein